MATTVLDGKMDLPVGRPRPTHPGRRRDQDGIVISLATPPAAHAPQPPFSAAGNPGASGKPLARRFRYSFY